MDELISKILVIRCILIRTSVYQLSTTIGRVVSLLIRLKWVKNVDVLNCVKNYGPVHDFWTFEFFFSKRILGKKTFWVKNFWTCYELSKFFCFQNFFLRCFFPKNFFPNFSFQKIFFPESFFLFYPKNFFSKKSKTSLWFLDSIWVKG